jgi:hypothetical protein
MEEIEDRDIVDSALDELIDGLVSDDASEEEFDEMADLFMSVYADLVDDGLIEPAPDDDSDDELKKTWVESSIPVIRDALNGEIDDDSDME